jgi:hypothetical protein
MGGPIFSIHTNVNLAKNHQQRFRNMRKRGSKFPTAFKEFYPSNCLWTGTTVCLVALAPIEMVWVVEI